MCEPHIFISLDIADIYQSIYIIDIYRIYISDIFVRKYRIFLIFSIFIEFLKIFFNVTHCDYVLIFSPCVLVAYDLWPQHFLSVGQLLSDFNAMHTHTYYYLVVNFI